MAFNLGKSDGENEDLAEINIIPLVDVMLVLLIIFMVTAPLSIGGISVNLPSSKAKGGKISEDRVVLSVTNQGEFYIEKLKIAPESLEARIRAIYQFRENKDLYIRADRDVPYGRVVDAMTAAKIGGVTKLSMLTQAGNKRN
jgi:biopolymer transport protein TolR